MDHCEILATFVDHFDAIYFCTRRNWDCYCIAPTNRRRFWIVARNV